MIAAAVTRTAPCDSPEHVWTADTVQSGDPAADPPAAEGTAYTTGLATATVLSYEHGYLRVLQRGPPLRDRLQPLVADGEVTIVPHLLLLCPLDGHLPDAVEHLDQRLAPVGSASSFVVSLAGAHRRPYGAHRAFEIGPKDGAGGRLLAAVEPVASVRTMRMVVEAMGACERSLPPLDTRQVVQQFAASLNATIARDAQLRDLVRLVVYDPAREGEAYEALLAAAQGVVEAPRSPPVPPVRLAPPVSIGVFLAWSFFNGYLQLVSGRRDLAADLTALENDSALTVALKKMVVVCPLTPRWTVTDGGGGAQVSADSFAPLDSQLERVQNAAGVDVGTAVPALSGRTYGSFSIYRVRDAQSGRPVGCFALELATPLRTLALGVAHEGLGDEMYRREAVSFVSELRTLLHEHPATADQFVVLAVEDGADISRQLAGLLEPSEQERH